MLEFARWKYVVIAVVLIFAALYSLPNVYPKDPAVQITANRGAAIDAALEARVALGELLLEPARVHEHEASELDGPGGGAQEADQRLQQRAGTFVDHGQIL